MINANPNCHLFKGITLHDNNMLLKSSSMFYKIVINLQCILQKHNETFHNVSFYLTVLLVYMLNVEFSSWLNSIQRHTQVDTSAFSYFQVHYLVICKFFDEYNSWKIFLFNPNEILESNNVKIVLSSKKSLDIFIPK